MFEISLLKLVNVGRFDIEDGAFGIGEWFHAVYSIDYLLGEVLAEGVPDGTDAAELLEEVDLECNLSWLSGLQGAEG